MQVVGLGNGYEISLTAFGGMSYDFREFLQTRCETYPVTIPSPQPHKLFEFDQKLYKRYYVLRIVFMGRIVKSSTAFFNRVGGYPLIG
jgi:hypothetical protein